VITSRFVVASCGFALCATGLAVAGNPVPVLTPTSYAMANGDGQASGGGFNYWDDTYNGVGNRNVDRSPLSGGLGQLTDRVFGTNAWEANLGNGPAQEWVGWRDFNPTITFTFAQPAEFTIVGVFANNSGFGGVSVFQSYTASFSNDGVTFTNPLTRTLSALERADTTARFYDLDTGGITAQYVRFEFVRANTWTFIGEVSFLGTIPAPGSAALLALAGVVCSRRRR
jgi:hypothetical protein